MKTVMCTTLHLRIGMFVIALALFHEMFVSFANSAYAQSGVQSAGVQSDTGLDVRDANQDQPTALLTISRWSLTRLADLVSRCSPNSIAPPLHILRTQIRNSEHSGSVGFELGESTERESCDARRFEPGHPYLADGDAGVVASASLVGLQCKRWKSSLAQYVAALRSPEVGNPCNARSVVRIALESVLPGALEIAILTADLGSAGYLYSWSAQLDDDSENVNREFSLFATDEKRLLLGLSVHIGDSLSTLSERITGRGTLAGARDIAMINGISDMNVIRAGQSVYFPGNAVKGVIWSTAASSTDVLSDIVTGTYFTETQFSWSQLSDQVWGPDTTLGIPWLWTVNPARAEHDSVSGEIRIPLEIGGWYAIGSEELDNWTGVDEASERSGLTLTPEERVGLMKVFCNADTERCVLPMFKILTLGSEVN